MSSPTCTSDDGQAVAYSPKMEDSVDDESLYDDADVESCKFSDVKYLCGIISVALRRPVET